MAYKNKDWYLILLLITLVFMSYVDLALKHQQVEDMETRLAICVTTHLHKFENTDDVA